MILSNVTIVSFSGTSPENAVKSIKYSTKNIKFNQQIVFSNNTPTNLQQKDNIQFILVPDLNVYTYNRFILHQLNDYINTDFCLITHDDGFIINPHLWSDDFLNYDYIGAPWRDHFPDSRVGNGGFSLRSKKFLRLSKELPWREGIHEDAECCIFKKDYFIKNGCVYAPLDIAMKFSLESKIPEHKTFNLDTCFGFHGRGNGEHFGGYGQQFKDKIELLNQID